MIITAFIFTILLESIHFSRSTYLVTSADVFLYTRILSHNLYIYFAIDRLLVIPIFESGNFLILLLVFLMPVVL